MEDKIEQIFKESSQTILESITLKESISKTVSIIANCLQKNNKIILFGNGGSAADAQHIAAELVGRFKLERSSIPAISLTTDTSIITSIGNDYSFDFIFKRQCESLVSSGDVVIGISTSGNSKNVIEGLLLAKQKGAITIALLGNDGGEIKDIVDTALIVNSSSVPRIQETHRVIYHIICELVELELTKMNQNEKSSTI